MFITLNRKKYIKKINKDTNFRDQLIQIYGDIVMDKYFFSKGGLFVFYQKDNNIIASLKINKKEDEENNKYYQIRSVFVNHEYRGQGYCKKIISHVIGILVKFNLPILLDVEPNNLPAINCYKANNFVEIGNKMIKDIEHITMMYKK